MFTIYSTNKNQQAAKELANRLNFSYEIATLRNFECQEELLSFDSISQENHAIIAHELWPDCNQKLIELLLLLDALESNGIKFATLVAPYIPYLRQDRELEKNAAIGSRMLAKLLDNTIINKIISIDVHSDKAASYFKQNFINLCPANFFGEIIQHRIKTLDNSLVVAPDNGSATRAERLAKFLNISHLVLEKNRKNNSLTISGFNKINFYENIIIVDDILDSGKTIQTTINEVKDNAQNIIICITHTINIENLERIKNLSNKIIIISTNSTNYINKNTYHNIWQIFDHNISS